MKLKYSDLPTRETCVKLSMISFSSPQKNFDVFKFAYALKPLQEYFGRERDKLLKKYGEETEPGKFRITGKDKLDAFNNDLNALQDVEINDSIPYPKITENDFTDNLCAYPSNKELWLNAFDIDMILSFIKKLE